MKISIITACFNNEYTIARALQSVADQDYEQIEHIIVDGASTDDTLAVISQFPHIAKLISEKDKGIYDALNKGLQLATGDVIAFLHSDDVFADSTVVSSMAHFFVESNCDGIYGDIIFVNEAGKKVRTYDSSKFQFKDFAKGKMPAHTSFFCRKEVYSKYPFDDGYRIAADFDQMLRAFADSRFRFCYRPITTTHMLVGGASTKNIKSRITINKEIMESCQKNGVKTTWFAIYSKYLTKIFEFVK